MVRAENHRSLLQRVIDRLPEDLKAVLWRESPRGPISEALATKRFDNIVTKARLRAQDHLRQFKEDFTDSARLGTDLLALPQDRRQMLILSQERFHTIASVTRLLRLSWQQRTVKPEDSEAIAELAVRVLERLASTATSEAIIEDLKARAWGQIGNARRIQTDQRGADQALSKAFKHLKRGTHDPMEDALLHHWTGSLRRDQRRFEDAISSLKHACRHYRQIHDAENHAQALLTLGCTHREAGDPKTGLQVMRRAAGLLGRDNPLVLYVRHNEIDCLIDLGRYAEAEALLNETRPLYAHASAPLVRLRLPWIEGRIAMHTNRFDEAEYLFQRVRQGFVDHGIALDAALVSLELAEVYAQQGRNEQVKELAQEMLAVFRSRNAERDAIAALLMLQHAASAERASLHVVRDIADRLRKRAPQALTPLSSEGG